MTILPTRLFLRVALLSVLALLANFPARALDPAVPITEYHHDIWTSRDGAPREVDTMAQTADGWLWLGTVTGLHRFDGVHFEPFKPAPGENLLGKRITSLTAQPNGDLWIGYTFGGLSRLRNGRLQHFASGPGNPIGATYNLAVESDDSIWVASTSGLMHYSGGRWEKIGADWDYPAGRAECVHLDQHGRLWAADGKALYLLDRGVRKFRPTGHATSSPLVLESPDGRPWLIGKDSMAPLPPAPGQPMPRSPWTNRAAAHSSLFDRHGNFWTGNCPTGLCRMLPATWQTQGGAFPRRSVDDKLDQPWQMSSLNVHSMLEDREGNIWVGTPAGLERLRPNKLRTTIFPPEAGRLSLAQEADGTTWVASSETGLLWQVDAAGRVVKQDPGQTVYVVARGRDGSVLIGGSQRIERRKAGLAESWPLPPLRDGENPRNFVLLLADDSSGTWVGIGGRGLYRRQNGDWIPQPGQKGLRAPLFIAVDGKGSSWFGLRNNKLMHDEHGKVTEYGPAQGIDLGNVTFVDVQRELLIAGDNGMAVLRGGRFVRLAAAEPDLLSNVSGIAVTLDGDRWINSSKGVVHVRAEDWQRSMADQQTPLRYELWDSSDGYPGAADIIVRVPTAMAGIGGKLWFVGTGGIAWVDPARVHRNTSVPAVRVTGMQSDGVQHALQAGTRLAPGTAKLQIDYTALTYTMPERVRFRYRLDGVDKDWQEAVARRTAYYTNLGPGTYRFSVEAINEDGVSSGVHSAEPFEIAPRFTQTAWFAGLCVLLAAALAYAAYRMRLRQLTRQFRERLHERLVERERIARALHDTFLQSLHGLILHFQAVANRLPSDSETRLLMDKTLNQADQVLVEGRDQVMGLRVTPSGSLAQALRDAGAVMAASGGCLDGGDGSFALSVRVSGKERQLTPVVHDEVYAIAREAMANACRHAGASVLDVELAYGAREFRLSVRDNGKGMDHDTRQHGRPGHWGLTGMRERAQQIGARFSIASQAGGGVEVALTIKAPQAYASS
jgi:signal transduction histidine kinase/ligand-binding sensor domain-containing protein